MALHTNNAEGKTSGTALAANDTGSGDAFNAVAKGATGNIVYSNAHAMHGINSYLVSGIAGDTATTDWNTGNDTSGAIRVYFYMTATPASAGDFFEFRNAAGVACKVQYSAAPKLIVANTAGATINNFATTLSLNTWYRVEMTAIIGTTTTNGTINVAYYLGDSLIPVETPYSSAVQNIGTTNLTIVRIGKITGATTTLNCFFDDYAWTPGSSTFIGPSVSPGGFLNFM